MIAEKSYCDENVDPNEKYIVDESERTAAEMGPKICEVVPTVKSSETELIANGIALAPTIKSSEAELIANGTALAPTIKSETELTANGGTALEPKNCEELQASENVQQPSEEEEEQLVDTELQLLKSKKIKEILEALVDADIQGLSRTAVSEYGLVTDDIRTKVWPKLIGIDVYSTSPRPTAEEIKEHPYHNQVLLDVNRSLKRFPPSIKEKQRLAMQDQLVLLIMRVLVKHPELHYYQGYHDICVTFLLVLGEEMAFHVVDKLSISHLEVFMKKTMEPTTNMLSYIYPIVQKEKPELFDFLEKSDVGIMFALSWLITWFGHVLNNYSEVVRLFDLFIISSPWLPVYLAASIVLYREEQIKKQECDMACVHSLLSDIPDDLPFEDLIIECLRLFEKYPPKSLEKTVLEQIRKKKEILNSNRRHKQSILSVIKKAVYTVMPRGRVAVSVAFATLVVFSAVLYQAYKT